MPADQPEPGQAERRLPGLGTRARRALRAALPVLVDNWQTNGDAQQDGAATMADVHHCYRLLLGRAPDPGGLEHYRRRLEGGGIGLPELVEEFLGSVEFVRARADRSRSAPGEGTPVEQVRTVEGFLMNVDPTDYAVGHTVARTGAYEPEVSSTVRRHLPPGGTFVDVGANMGWFSLLAAGAVGPGGHVLAVEPNPANVELLRSSARDNGFANIEAHCVALADEPGTVALETDGSNGRVIPIDGPPPAPVRASFVVAALPLDDLVERAGLDRVDLVKIDVEGAEPLALRGARRALQTYRPVLVSEFYPLALDLAPWGSAQGYLDMLRALGYRLQVIGTDGEQDDGSVLEMAGAPGTDHVDLLCLPA